MAYPPSKYSPLFSMNSSQLLKFKELLGIQLIPNSFKNFPKLVFPNIKSILSFLFLYLDAKWLIELYFKIP